jgi:DinB superfamily
MQDLSFPIGKFEKEPFSADAKKKIITDLRFLPGLLEQAILNLDESQLYTPYREGGWTIQQVVHHVADSHMNGFIRFKLALTEENPTIKPYDQDAWAKLEDYLLPVNISLTLLHTIHARWVKVAEAATEQDLQRTFTHPEYKTITKLWDQLGSYAWHGKHHVAHITSLRERMRW